MPQVTAEVRLRWDPFIRRQLLGAQRPAAGVRTFTRGRLGPAMVTRSVSYRPPTSVGMTTEKGPWFLETFGGRWRFAAETRDGVAGTRATWKYTWTAKPAWLRPLADPVGRWLLGREIRARIAAYAAACTDRPSSMLPTTRRPEVWTDPGSGDVTFVSTAEIVQVALTAFVLLAPTMMVAVLVSGLSRREGSVEQPGADLRGLLVADRVLVPVEQDDDRAVA